MTETYRSIASHWAEMEQNVLTGDHLTEEDRSELRGMFYAGCGRLFHAMVELLSEPDMPEAEFERIVRGWDDELIRFTAELRQPRRKRRRRKEN